jgi:hypothetical protein
MENPKIRAIPAPWYDGIEISIRQRAGSNLAIVQDVTFVTIKPGQLIKPTLVIDKKAAQVLIDDLWASGIRPTEGKGSAGSLKATENHLEDMRRIVANKLKIIL